MVDFQGTETNKFNNSNRYSEYPLMTDSQAQGTMHPQT